MKLAVDQVMFLSPIGVFFPYHVGVFSGFRFQLLTHSHHFPKTTRFWNQKFILDSDNHFEKLTFEFVKFFKLYQT